MLCTPHSPAVPRPCCCRVAACPRAHLMCQVTRCCPVSPRFVPSLPCPLSLPPFLCPSLSPSTPATVCVRGVFGTAALGAVARYSGAASGDVDTVLGVNARPHQGTATHQWHVCEEGDSMLCAVCSTRAGAPSLQRTAREVCVRVIGCGCHRIRWRPFTQSVPTCERPAAPSLRAAPCRSASPGGGGCAAVSVAAGRDALHAHTFAHTHRCRVAVRQPHQWPVTAATHPSTPVLSVQGL